MLTWPAFNLLVLAKPLCATYNLVNRVSISLGSSLAVVLPVVVSRGV